MASATQRQTVKQKRRAPAFFEYDPAPLRVTEPADPVVVGGHATAPYVELVLYDFGAVSVSYAISLEGPLGALPDLSTALYGNEPLETDARRRVHQLLLETLGDAALRTRVAEFVEDYVILRTTSSSRSKRSPSPVKRRCCGRSMPRPWPRSCARNHAPCHNRK